MISEGSRDTKYWNMADENSALRHRNTLFFKVYLNRKTILKIAIIFHNITVVFDQINTALMSIRDSV